MFTGSAGFSSPRTPLSTPPSFGSKTPPVFATKTPPSSFGQAASNKSRGAVVVSGGKAAAAAASSAETANVGGMAIKKNETFVRRLSTEQAKKTSAHAQSSTPSRPEPVKLQQENFQAAAETAPRKVIMAGINVVVIFIIFPLHIFFKIAVEGLKGNAFWIYINVAPFCSN